ncbi:putative RNA methylase family UPF0020-domain-containing protein [Gongronella butleri]|nr:putative RNA methylase family UPF0020-domain-containing protein [Gongronella butleri]
MTSIHLVCRVPEGLEDVALADLKARLPKVPLVSDASFVAEEGTGRVHIFAQHASPVELVHQQLSQHVLSPSVYDTVLVVGTKVLPRAVYKDHATPNALGLWLADYTGSIDWAQHIVESVPQRFRATFRKQQLNHHVKTQELSGWVGEAFGNIYTDWKVNLTSFEYNVMGEWGETSRDAPLIADTPLKHQLAAQLPPDSDENHDNHDEHKKTTDTRVILVHVGLALPQPDTKYRHRIHLGRTSLSPPIAYCLARLADPQPGQIIFDMCCGTGTIPIEGAMHFPSTLWLGGEVKVKTVCKLARENVDYAGADSVQLMLCDGRKMCLRDGCVDTVLSDWPWGIREGSYTTVQKLYPKFVKQMYRVLRPSGRAIVVSQGSKLMKRVLEYPWVLEKFTVEKQMAISIGGLPVNVYMLQSRK